jgi:hypothetical protein
MPLTAMGIKQTTFMSLIKFENDYLKLMDKMQPLATSYTQTDNIEQVHLKRMTLSYLIKA